MSWIEFKGINGNDIGVLMPLLPDFHRPKRNVTYTPVSGRDGRLGVDDGTYDAYQTSMRVDCNGVPLSTVYDWLSGSGWLRASTEPNRRVKADLNMQISGSHFRMAKQACYDTLSVSAYCQPYRYFYPDEPADVITDTPYSIRNPGTAPCRPRITIEALGDVTLMLTDLQSGRTWLMEFEGLTDGVIVDCDMEECLSLDEKRLLNSIATFDDYPELPSGSTAISWSGAVMKVTVEKRCRDL